MVADRPIKRREQVLRVARGLGGEEPIRTLNGAVLKRKQVAAVVEAAIEARRAGTLADLPDVDAKRADILLAGALILEGVVRRFAVKELVISEYALREGVFLDTLQRQVGTAQHRLRDVARRSVLDLVAACDEDAAHSQHVAWLALELFDATASLHGLGDEARSLLEAGALLANVGLVISHAKHHKHSYYVVRNSDRLVGFTDGEIEMVAQIARYHRKSAPKPTHPEWAALDPDAQEIVRVAASVLRIAIGMDRSHRQLVTGVDVAISDGEVAITMVSAAADADLSLGLYAAEQATGLLAEVAGRPIRISDPNGSSFT